MAVSCENDNELSGSIRDREFLDRLSDQQLLKKFLLHEVDLSDVLPVLCAMLSHDYIMRSFITCTLRQV
jgi:hypothetical protein